jgi:hypothetical protein
VISFFSSRNNLTQLKMNNYVRFQPQNFSVHREEGTDRTHPQPLPTYHSIMLITVSSLCHFQSTFSVPWARDSRQSLWWHQKVPPRQKCVQVLCTLLYICNRTQKHLNTQTKCRFAIARYKLSKISRPAPKWHNKCRNCYLLKGSVPLFTDRRYWRRNSSSKLGCNL